MLRMNLMVCTLGGGGGGGGREGGREGGKNKREKRIFKITLIQENHKINRSYSFSHDTVY